VNRAAWCLAIPSVALGAEPSWDQVKRLELTYQALSAVDAVQTLHCLHQDKCEEFNPLLGNHPSAGRLVATKVVLGALHYHAIERIYERSPRWAQRLEYVSIAFQGSVVALNLRWTF
jgi:hypothetical protein